jgi:ATP-binding cassette subfamily B protein
VLDQGRVADAGTHNQLLERDGVYTALWRKQDRARGWRLIAQRQASSL